MSALRLAAHQFRFDQKSFWRNPASIFFTVALPVLFLVIFNVLFGGEELEGLGGIDASAYYVPAIITLAVISATMQSLAIALTFDRESGVLKRGRGTPMPSWAFFAGRIGNAVVVSVLLVACVIAIGRIFYGVEIPWDRFGLIAATLAVGGASFCALGIALTAIIPNEDAAAAITNVAVLPLYFLSGVFVPETEIPDGVLSVAEHFPVRHFFEAFYEAFDPAGTGGSFDWGNLLFVGAWGLVALVLAVRFFRWSPRAS